MNSPTTLTGLVARTVECEPRPQHFVLNGDGFVWRDPTATIVTQGIAARVHAQAVGDALRAIAVDDIDNAGRFALPRAVGALPFDPLAPALLDIPVHTVTHTADGRWFVTTIGDATMPVPTSADDLTIEPGRFVVERATSPDAWAQLIDTALAAIDADVFTKVVLAREALVAADAPFDVVQVLQRLEAQNPAAFVYAHTQGATTFLGASPELLVARDGALVTSRPMAGTVPRSAGTTADADIDAALHTLKHEHEHALVVDAVCASLQHLGVTITSADPEVVHLPTLAHLATLITGNTTRDVSALDLARALHPTPAVGGTPTDAALKFLTQHEGFARNRYAGPVGWVDASGDGAFAVALRCAEISGASARLIAGAGIVAGSEPEAEWAETQAKLEPMLRALVRP